MKKHLIIYLVCLFFGTLCGSVFGDDLSEIVLNDGTTIYGEVVSLSNGIYTLKTNHLGIIEIGKSKIRSIRLKAEGETKQTQTAPSLPQNMTDIQAIQKRIAEDPELMNSIRSLQDDPQVQKAMQDPKVIEAFNAGDLGALMADPKILELLNNPKINDIQKKVIK